LIIKADYITLIEIEKFLGTVDKQKSEVVLDIEILEVTKNLINSIGLSFGGDASSPLSTISAGVVGADGTIKSTVNFDNLKNTNFFLTIPTAALNFLESDDKNKIVARPNLRGIDGEDIQFMVGDRVPVPQTQFQAGAAGGFNNIPVTTYQYQDVGVQVKITPYIHRNNEVTLKVKLTINSISGYEGGFPIFGKREVENIIRLKEGETNIIGGFIRDEVRGGSSGIVGLSRIPLLGKLFGASGRTLKQTDLIFSITPRPGLFSTHRDGAAGFRDHALHQAGNRQYHHYFS
jgi:general secretion pathway protein D